MQKNILNESKWLIRENGIVTTDNMHMCATRCTNLAV